MSLTAHQRPHRGASDVWLTPPEIIDAVGPFDLDPCAAPVPRPWPTADRHITPPDDGLTAEWAGFVWCNPPFGPEAGRWLDRMADHGHGIALCPARTETRWFVNTVWRRASSVLFLHGRPHFHYPDGTRGKANSGAPIVLVAYGPAADARLASCGLAGSFVPVPAPAPTDGEPVSALDRITVNAAELTRQADEGARQRPDTEALRRIAAQTHDDGTTPLTRAEHAFLSRVADWIDAQPDAAPPAPSTPAHPDEGTERPDTAALREIADRFLLDEDGGILLREACDWIDAQRPVPPTPAPQADGWVNVGAMPEWRALQRVEAATADAMDRGATSFEFDALTAESQGAVSDFLVAVEAALLLPLHQSNDRNRTR